MDNYTEKDYVKVAIMYYDEGMTQAEIAKKMGVSRSLISKMLIEAREAKIVEIFINSQSVYTTKLERELEEVFSLSDAVVVDTIGLTKSEIERKVSRVAANYIESYLRRHSDIKRIGVSWGNTLHHVVHYLPYLHQSDYHIYPLIGGMGNEHFYLHANQLVQTVAQKFRAQAHYLYVPAMISNLSLKKELEQDPTISCVLNQGKQVDLGIFGLAALEEESTMVKTGYISVEDVHHFHEMGGVGDINSQFFDNQGKSLSKINDRVMGVSLEDLKQISEKMLIAYGTSKAHAIQVAMEYKMVNILITTDETAQAILKEVTTIN
ncbi:sugar-binding transcriptional regulator [Streptococcus cameli]